MKLTKDIIYLISKKANILTMRLVCKKWYKWTRREYQRRFPIHSLNREDYKKTKHRLDHKRLTLSLMANVIGGGPLDILVNILNTTTKSLVIAKPDLLKEISRCHNIEHIFTLYRFDEIDFKSVSKIWIKTKPVVIELLLLTELITMEELIEDCFYYKRYKLLKYYQDYIITKALTINNVKTMIKRGMTSILEQSENFRSKLHLIKLLRVNDPDLYFRQNINSLTDEDIIISINKGALSNEVYDLIMQRLSINDLGRVKSYIRNDIYEYIVKDNESRLNYKYCFDIIVSEK
jgi:hypothetical protein